VTATYGPTCTVAVQRPIMMHRWDTLTFLHWTFEPDVVKRLLPPHLKLDTFEDQAYVGLIPFNMRVYLPHTRPVPWASMFCETNVRTYVLDEQGRPGIWFFSLDASRLGAVVTARATFRLPYMWSQMALEKDGNTVSYTCKRRWPGPRGATSKAIVDIGTPYQPAELTQRDHFLTARWRLFSSSDLATAVGRGSLSHGATWQRFGDAEHEPWVLHRATARVIDDHLVAAAGLPQPNDEPLVHYSPGVDVRIGRPHRQGSQGAGTGRDGIAVGGLPPER
jgi:uncharacterized protein